MGWAAAALFFRPVSQPMHAGSHLILSFWLCFQFLKKYRGRCIVIAVLKNFKHYIYEVKLTTENYQYHKSCMHSVCITCRLNAVNCSDMFAACGR